MTQPFMPSPNTIANVNNKIFIVSLPRTGTKSLTKMLMILGYKASHCPSIRFEWELHANVNEVYADTPIYRPSLFGELAKNSSNKFIFIDRDIDSWLKSFETQKLHNSYLDYISRDDAKLHRVSKLDRDSLVEVFQEPYYTSELAKVRFQIHREKVEELIPPDQLLVYNFNDGWNPLCNFLGKQFPEIDIPHINKDTLFEKIV